MNSKRRSQLFVPGGLLVGVLLTAGIIALVGGSNNDPRSMSPGDRDQAMQSMMGTKDSSVLPLKKASDAKPIEPVVKDGVKEFNLIAEPIRWQYAKGKTITAWAYNGQVPGPEIRVTEGDKVKITLTNKLPKATTLHWHGIDVPYNMDGVPGVSQTAIEPGKTFTYEFTATAAGTHFYHTHGSAHNDEAQQLDMGLSGAFIVEPKDYQKPDKEFTLVLDDWQAGMGDFNMAMQNISMDHGMAMNYNLFTMNGLAAPDTKALDVKQGERIKIRFINASSSTTHPMHLHGHQSTIVALDGNELKPEQQYKRSTITVNPGETTDIEVIANNPGVWAFHCHELHHAGSGMLTLFKYEGFSTLPPSRQQDSDMNMNDGMMMDHSGH
jgi:FtsP/CotA-like multicopper oxidase with cupredoxin domain